MNKYIKHIFLSCLLFANFALVAGQLDPITGILRTTSTYTVTVGTPTAEITVTAPAPGTAIDYNVLDLVALNFDHNSNLFLTNPASVLTRLTITKYDASYNIIGSPDTVSLAVYNDNRYNKETRDKSIYKTSNAYQLKVVIDEILVNGIIVPNLPSYVYIEPEIRITRYSSLSLTAPLMNGIDPLNTDCDGLGTIDELKLNWGPVSGAEEFQVEWTYVNDYGFTPTSSIAQGDLYADFKSNATRITTNGSFQEYRITLAYEKGYIAFRVRAVGRDPLDPSKFIYGNWTSGTSDLINLSALTSDEIYYNTDEHEGKKNWQYSATFAEQGKKKEVISYFDGSLHNRQSVTKVNSDRNVIVGETIYDFQGRPAISVLATPVNSPACTDTLAEEPALMYYENYNRNLAGTPYSKANFDVDFSGQCATFAPPMDTTFGSSQYYSGNNPFKRFHQAFIPNADMYPFSQVEYTPDNTGRIRSQSGVGKTFRLGSQHETKYIYSQPNQIQLDRLFGSEVGDAAHYKKNTVSDANGQISISYLNQEGKTIATSLAGNPPTDSLGVIYLEALQSEALAAVPFTVDAFNKDINGNSLSNTITPLEDGIEFSTQLSVSYNSTYIFNYELNIDTLSDPCLRSVPNGYCISCIYDLEIKVTDECGVNLTPLGTATGDTIHKLVGHLDPTTNGFTMTCGSPTGTNDVESITLNLTPGVYTVSKTLTINKDARDFYLEKYLDSVYNSCIKTNFDFVQEALAQVDTLSCYGSCSECVTALGSKEDFIAAGEGTEIQYDYLLERCLDPCKDLSLCEAAYEIMLVDVTPGGQYAKFDASTNTSSDNLSVLNVHNNLNSNFSTGGVGIFGNWKKPILVLNGNTYTQYLDDLGQRVRVPVVVSTTSSSGYLPEVENVTTLIFTDATDGSKYTYPENLKFLNDFIPVWNEYFARSLVIYHPEFAYYMACKDQSRLMSGDVRTADQFDSLLIATNGFNAAVTAKFIKPGYATITNPANRVYDWEVHVGPGGHMYDPIITDITNPGRFNDFRGPFGSTYNEVPGYVHFPLAAQMIAKIDNYATINSVNYSMAEVAALIARCGNNFYAAPTGNCINFGVDFINNPLSDPVIAQINDSIRDKEWENYKHFYIAEKRKLEYNRMNFFALHIVNSSDPAMPSSNILGGCNVCLGNPGFNPFLSGFYSPFPFFSLSSPAYDVSQPCSFPTRGYFANAQKRFVDPANTGLGGTDVAYSVYQQTGQCPMAFQLHGFLNAMTQGHYFYPAATTSLNTISAFNPDMYDAMNGGVSPSVYINYNWNVVSSSAGIIVAQITDPVSSAVKCTFTLDITGTPIPDFTYVQSLQNLEFDFSSGGLDHFKIWASYNTTPGGPVTNVEIKGSSCIKITDCQFEPQCSPNVFAVDFMNVLNVMKANGLELNTNYNMSANPAIAPALSTVLKNTLGTPNSALIWNFVTPNKVEIFDNTNPTTKIVVTNLTSSVVGTGTVVAYANIKSNYNNLFKMDGIDASGNVILKINGKVEKITPTVTSGISMGDCGLPTNRDCSLTEHIVRTDLEKLLDEFLTIKPFVGNVNLYSLASFSSLLQGYLPNSLTSTSSTYDFNSGATTSYDTLIFNTSAACTFELYHNLNHLNSQPKNFGDLLSVDHLTGIPPFDANQNYHNFYFVGTYTNGSSTVTDTVWGTSCFPIKNCNACEPSSGGVAASKTLDSISVAEGRAYYEPSLISYYAYKNAIDTVNTRNGWDSTNVDYVATLDYENFVTKGYQNAIQYVRFLVNFDSIVDSTKFLNIDKFIYAYGNLTNCKEEYDRYVRSINAYNNRAVASSATLLNPITDSTFYANNLCDTSFRYVRYLRDYPDAGLTPQTIFEYFGITGGSVFLDSCNVLYKQYVAVYNVFSADSVVQQACKDANQLHPLFSLAAIQSNNVCCSNQGLGVFNNYISGLANASTSCPPMLQSLKLCAITIVEQDVSPVLCHRNYIYFISKLNQYNASAYAIAHAHSLDPNIYPSYFLFQKANYCECIIDYINYLNTYIAASGGSTLPLPDDIDHFGGCTHTIPPVEVDSCKTLWTSYFNAVTAYNSFVLRNHPGDPNWPTIDIIYTPAEFTAKYCHCADQFIADLIAVINGSNPTPEELKEIINISNACEEPCLNTPPDTAFTFPPVPYSQNPCVAQMLNIAIQNANNAYNQYVDSVTTYFVTRYNEHCLHPEEDLFYDYDDKEYHFTLYYYDQAGNLVKTIPPAGVEYLDIDSPTSFDELRVKQDRFNNTKTVYTQHRMATTYEYNSLNQLVRQDMPDHDKMDICENLLPNGLDADLVINNVQVVSSNKGYLTGSLTRTIASVQIKRGYVYTSNDGGQNWLRVKGLAGANIQKVQFVSSTEGFAVADYGMVLKTLDGGASWDVLTSLYNSSPKYFSDLNDLIFISPAAGIVGGIGKVYRTTNGGTTFTVGTGFAGTDTITGLTYDAANFYASVKNGAVGKIYTSSTGLTWTLQSTIAAGMLKKVRYVTNTVAYAVGYDGTLLKSNGANTSWDLVATNDAYKFSDVYFKDASNGIALVDSVVGLSRIYKTFDGGLNWITLSAPGKYYSSIQMYDASADKLIASGDNGSISKVLMNTPTFGMMNASSTALSASTDDIKFTDAYLQGGPNKLISLAVTNTANVYFTYDANATPSTSINWELFNTGISGGFKKGLISVSGTTGSPIAQGLLLNNGVLYTFFRTFSSATPTYAPVTITGGGTQYFSDITAENQNGTGIFYAFDSVSKRIYKVQYASSTTAPASAAVFSTAVTQPINGIAMSNNGQRLLLVGNSGAIHFATGITTGSTSVALTSATNAVTPLPLNDITGIATATAIAVGNDGTLWKTTNSGANWRLTNTSTANKLNAIASNASAVGLIAGNNGQVYAASNLLLSDAVLSPIATTVTTHFTDVAIGTTNNAYATTKNGSTIFIADYTVPVAVNTLANNVNGSLNGVTFKPAIADAYAVGNGTGIINYLGSSGFVMTDVFTQGYYGMSFYDNNNGYVIDSGYVLRHTINAGNNWSVVLPQPSTPLTTKVFAVAANKAILVGGGNYAALINGNSIPVPVAVGSAPPASRYMDINFNQTGYGVIVGTNRVTASITPSGSSYIINFIGTPTTAPPNYRFHAVHVFGDNSFIGAGSKGNIYYYKSGTGFVKQSNYIAPATTDVFNDIYFHDDRVGYVVGNDGRAYKCVLEKNIMEPGSPGLTTNAIVWDELCPLAIYNGLTPAQVHFNAFAFSSRTQGFFGGSYSSSPGVLQRHAVILNDESDLYSTRFWYDKLGRMVISQNTKQINKTPSAYSYTLYDELGRIKEVGEKFENTTATKQKTIFGTNINGLFNLKAIDDAKLLLWVNDITGSRNEVTKTYYDATIITPLPFTQDNLRKRVATVTYEDLFDGDDQTYQHASHYSYDIHGNVKTMLQDNPSLATLIVPQQFKRIDYDYDLISGKVNKVTYQPNERDQFIHRYSYDSDNRITITETSSDNIVYDVDAKYFYYAHGPLARVEYGNNAVQGIDYAYTLQGWIKGVNSNTLNADRDMGKDGSDLIAGHPNKIFARDAFGYTLNYFQGDYKQIDYMVWNNALKRFEATTSGSLLQGARNNLFNGNISSMVTTVQEIDTTTLGNANAPNAKPLGNAYKYDQLNRIMSSQSYTNLTLANNDWENAGPFTANMYANSFTYDANGNILSQHQSDVAGAEYNAMLYKYRTDATGKLLQNRLYHVRDNTTYTGLQTDDIDDQGQFNANPLNININNNYNFDEIGNLKKDSTEQIANIEWTVYGKIKRITRDAGSTKDNLVFEYDASGNRIAKHVYDGSNNWKYSTYYVRDAQGNVMSTYDKRIPSSGTGFSYKLLEQNLYGSSRIGLNYPDKEMQSNVTTALILHVLGRKQFEISDHLGNVNSVVSDRKIPVQSTIIITEIAYYVADISSTSSYSAFGSLIKDRTFEDFKNFRYKFNGKESDSEINGKGNVYDFGSRIYDSRLGRWLSLDPLMIKYPHLSPYNSFENSPIYFMDPDGRDVIAGNDFLGKSSNMAGFKIFTESKTATTFLDKFASVNGNLYTNSTSSSGALSRHDIKFTNNAGANAYGGTTLKYYNEKGEAVEYKEGSVITENTKFQIEIGIFIGLSNSDSDAGFAAGTINHETFVHAESFAKVLALWEDRANNGMTLEEFKAALNAANTDESTDKEHSDMGKGDITNFNTVFREIKQYFEKAKAATTDKKELKKLEKQEDGFEDESFEDNPNLKEK